jgi:hypothetical protein
VARRGGDRDLDAREPAHHGERPRDVVPVADVGEPAPRDVAERLAHRQQVGERLARVVLGREHVDHGDLGVLGELAQRGLRARPQRDRGHMTGEHERRVADGLAARELQLPRPQDHRVAAELDDPDLERRARPRRRLLEDERDGPPLERARRVRRLLEDQRAVEQRAELARVELRSGEEVPWQARHLNPDRRPAPV